MSQDPKQSKNPLRRLSNTFARSQFTNQVLEFVIPKSTEVIWLADMFVSDYLGGAELTSEAIIAKSPYKVFKIHSQSMTIEMIERNKDKYWIVSNFTSCDPAALAYLAACGTKYSVVEYDYKYCMFRSEVQHHKTTGQPCDCPLRPHGILIEKLFTNAQHVFWMSEAQKERFLSRMPALLFGPEGQHVIQSSTFTDDIIDSLLGLSQFHTDSAKKLPVKIWGVQGSSNWIKGTQETLQMCAQKKLPVKILGNMPYQQFLKELARCGGFVFHPLDLDTCPRVTIEAKVMGLDLDLNDNVQHKDEPWFSGTVEDTVSYLRGRGDHFWKHIVR